MTKIPFYDNLDDIEVLADRVFVYRNLKFKGDTVYSVRDVSTGRVIAHTKQVTLSGVEFVVGQKGRERVVKEKQKNVHAGFRGTPTNKDIDGEWVSVTYNPYKYKTFVKRDNESPVRFARLARLDKNGGKCKQIVNSTIYSV